MAKNRVWLIVGAGIVVFLMMRGRTPSGGPGGLGGLGSGLGAGQAPGQQPATGQTLRPPATGGIPSGGTAVGLAGNVPSMTATGFTQLGGKWGI